MKSKIIKLIFVLYYSLWLSFNYNRVIGWVIKYISIGDDADGQIKLFILYLICLIIFNWVIYWYEITNTDVLKVYRALLNNVIWVIVQLVLFINKDIWLIKLLGIEGINLILDTKVNIVLLVVTIIISLTTSRFWLMFSAVFVLFSLLVENKIIFPDIEHETTVNLWKTAFVANLFAMNRWIDDFINHKIDRSYYSKIYSDLKCHFKLLYNKVVIIIKKGLLKLEIFLKPKLPIIILNFRILRVIILNLVIIAICRYLLSKL